MQSEIDTPIILGLYNRLLVFLTMLHQEGTRRLLAITVWTMHRLWQTFLTVSWICKYELIFFAFFNLSQSTAKIKKSGVHQYPEQDAIVPPLTGKRFMPL